MKQIFIIILFCLLSCFCVGQTLCQGKLLDSISGQPIEFANIGIVGKGFGTVSDENGEYSLNIPDSLVNESIRISIIGYRSKIFTPTNFQKLNQLRLSPNATNLNEVTVSAKKLKIKIAGNNTTTKSVSGGFAKNSLGAEMGIKLQIKNRQTQLRKLMIHINRNSLDTTPVFRFNVYKLDDKGNPGENILKENIIVKPLQKTGLVELDLKPYNIFVNEDVIITLEWIKDLGDAKGLYFSTKLVGSATYFRRASQDKWHKSPVGVGLHVEVAY